jgi:hypothetical protein
MEVKSKENIEKEVKNPKVTETKNNDEDKKNKPENKIKETEKKNEDNSIEFSQLWGGVNYII